MGLSLSIFRNKDKHKEYRATKSHCNIEIIGTIGIRRENSIYIKKPVSLHCNDFGVELLGKFVHIYQPEPAHCRLIPLQFQFYL